MIYVESNFGHFLNGSSQENEPHKEKPAVKIRVRRRSLQKPGNRGRG